MNVRDTIFGSGFLEIVKSLFELQKFDIVDLDASNERTHGFDLLVDQNNIRSVVQTKLFRSRFAANTSILASARQLSDAARKTRVVYSIMFVMARVDANALLRPNGAPGICVFDYDAIGLLLRPYPDLLSRFRERVRKAFPPKPFPYRIWPVSQQNLRNHDHRLHSSESLGT